MSKYETLTLCIALLASVIAAASLWRTSRTTKEQLSLQRIMADLARKQLEQIQKKELAQSAPKITFRLEGSERSAHRFVVENVGEGQAENVSFELIPQGGLESPLIERDYNQKFPIPVLGPGCAAGALAAFSLGSATSFRVILRWSEDGAQREQETYVSL
ncbi:MAG: hypothetical protein EVA65_05490 [Oceanococcus sp.]|nr:MAG: hypothetical protein EVA65_05490 [Oceanococcus sp.]